MLGPCLAFHQRYLRLVFRQQSVCYPQHGHDAYALSAHVLIIAEKELDGLE